VCNVGLHLSGYNYRMNFGGEVKASEDQTLVPGNILITKDANCRETKIGKTPAELYFVNDGCNPS